MIKQIQLVIQYIQNAKTEHLKLKKFTVLKTFWIIKSQNKLNLVVDLILVCF